MAEGKKNARRWRATIAFIDESGFSLIPPTRRTWARRGHTPVIRHQFNWPKLSAISAVTRKGRLYLHLVRGSVRSRNVILFLESLLRRIHRRIIVIWDNIGIHRSREVTSWLKQHRHRITVERLPAYACELNADEGVWQYLKGAPLGNYCPRNIEELAEQIRKSTRKLRRRSDIVRGFFRQTPLAKV